MTRRPPGRSTYEARTRDIVVRVSPAYLPEQSRPEDGRWAWAYTVEIENHGQETVTLVTRHWIITDALNRVEEVQGPGVVGEQPRLKGGEAFRYQSGCPLPTSSGAMRGTYQMVSESGEGFDVEIPEFSLHLPDATRRVN
ncbi:MAG: Co2+/Mg2+ efflux protein ApaG [Caulobacter sp.]|jgi:ApaG protein|nr:Co2+/Mg2+ efflux protein ApaG [Caulobacter sp.]